MLDNVHYEVGNPNKSPAAQARALTTPKLHERNLIKLFINPYIVEN